jgi:hypothetical protein
MRTWLNNGIKNEEMKNEYIELTHYRRISVANEEGYEETTLRTH